MAKEPQHRQPEGVKFEQPKTADIGLFGAPDVLDAAPLVEERGTDVWGLIPKDVDSDRFPFNGAPVLLRGANGETEEVVFRFTRRFVTGRWIPIGFWVKRNAGGAGIGFEPVAYRKTEE